MRLLLIQQQQSVRRPTPVIIQQTHPEASSGAVGLQAQMNTSLVWPCSVVTRAAGISNEPSPLGAAAGAAGGPPAAAACMKRDPDACSQMALPVAV
jgi:hypothetical protein